MKQFRRRFPLKPKSVRTPPAKFVYQPASPEHWVTETITMTKDWIEGKMHIKSDSCMKLVGTQTMNKLWEADTDFLARDYCFKEVFWLFKTALVDKGLHPQLHEEESGDTATISLRYKVPAQPAGKVPTRLSPKLRP